MSIQVKSSCAVLANGRLGSFHPGYWMMWGPKKRARTGFAVILSWVCVGCLLWSQSLEWPEAYGDQEAIPSWLTCDTRNSDIAQMSDASSIAAYKTLAWALPEGQLVSMPGSDGISAEESGCLFQELLRSRPDELLFHLLQQQPVLSLVLSDSLLSLSVFLFITQVLLVHEAFGFFPHSQDPRSWNETPRIWVTWHWRPVDRRLVTWHWSLGIISTAAWPTARQPPATSLRQFWQRNCIGRGWQKHCIVPWGYQGERIVILGGEGSVLEMFLRPFGMDDANIRRPEVSGFWFVRGLRQVYWWSAICGVVW